MRCTQPGHLPQGSFARCNKDMLSQHGAPVVVPPVPHDLPCSEQHALALRALPAPHAAEWPGKSAGVSSRRWAAMDGRQAWRNCQRQASSWRQGHPAARRLFPDAPHLGLLVRCRCPLDVIQHRLERGGLQRASAAHQLHLVGAVGHLQ